MSNENQPKDGDLKHMSLAEKVKSIREIVLLLAALFGFAAAVFEYTGKKKALDEKDAALGQVVVSLENARAAEAEAARLKKQIDDDLTNLPNFIGFYQGYMVRLDNSIKSYQEISDKTKARQGIINAAKDFVDYVRGWRVVNAAQRELINGPIKELEEALAANDIQRITNALGRIQSLEPTLSPILEEAIKNMRR